MPRFKLNVFSLISSSQVAFTLIEILIAISIISILSLAVLPSYRAYNEQQLLKNTSQNLVQTIRKAQINSQTRLKCTDGRYPNGWRVDIAVSGYNLTASCQNGDGSISDDYSPSQVSFPAGIIIDTVSNPPKMKSLDCPVTPPLTITFLNNKPTAAFSPVCLPNSPSSQKLQFSLINSRTQASSTITVTQGGAVDVAYQ